MGSDLVPDLNLPALDELISVSEAARVLGRHASRLTKRAKLGQFPAERVGGT